MWGPTKKTKADAKFVSTAEPSVAQQYEDVNVNPSHSRTKSSCTPQQLRQQKVPAGHEGALGNNALVCKCKQRGQDKQLSTLPDSALAKSSPRASKYSCAPQGDADTQQVTA